MTARRIRRLFPFLPVHLRELPLPTDLKKTETIVLFIALTPRGGRGPLGMCNPKGWVVSGGSLSRFVLLLNGYRLAPFWFKSLLENYIFWSEIGLARIWRTGPHPPTKGGEAKVCYRNVPTYFSWSVFASLSFNLSTSSIVVSSDFLPTNSFSLCFANTPSRLLTASFSENTYKNKLNISNR